MLYLRVFNKGNCNSYSFDVKLVGDQTMVNTYQISLVVLVIIICLHQRYLRGAFGDRVPDLQAEWGRSRIEAFADKSNEKIFEQGKFDAGKLRQLRWVSLGILNLVPVCVLKVTFGNLCSIHYSEGGVNVWALHFKLVVPFDKYTRGAQEALKCASEPDHFSECLLQSFFSLMMCIIASKYSKSISPTSICFINFIVLIRNFPVSKSFYGYKIKL